MNNSVRLVNFAANFALTLALAALGAALWHGYVVKHESHTLGANSIATHLPKAGQSAPALPDVDYSLQSMSLIVFLSTTCRYCEMSAPFYERLQRQLTAANSDSRLFLVFRETPGEVRKFKATLGLSAQSVAAVDLPELGIHSTPTALLVDNTGVIRRVWLGMSENNEASITAALADGREE